jgi:hypothetical protein
MTGTDVGGSVFRLEPAIPPVIQTITQTNNVTTLQWNSRPGQFYKVEFTTSLEVPTWIAYGYVVFAENSNASVQDFDVTAQRFYRVVLMP